MQANENEDTFNGSLNRNDTREKAVNIITYVDSAINPYPTLRNFINAIRGLPQHNEDTLIDNVQSYLEHALADEDEIISAHGLHDSLLDDYRYEHHEICQSQVWEENAQNDLNDPFVQYDGESEVSSSYASSISQNSVTQPQFNIGNLQQQVQLNNIQAQVPNNRPATRSQEPDAPERKYYHGMQN